MKKHKKRYILLLSCLLALIYCLLVSCNKEVTIGRLPDGYVAVTFDDYSVENWYTNLPVLESLGIKATFYVSNYHTLKLADKQKLIEIKNRGHEIAYHTTNHPNLLNMLNKEGWTKVNDEISRDMLLMQQDGFILTDFAYPYGRHDASLDRALLKTFKTVRAVCNKTNYYQSLVMDGCEKQVLFGAGIDANSKITDSDIGKLLTKAKEKKACAILVAHQINSNSKHQVTIDKLKLIAAKASELNLKFICVNQIY